MCLNSDGFVGHDDKRYKAIKNGIFVYGFSNEMECNNRILCRFLLCYLTKTMVNQSPPSFNKKKRTKRLEGREKRWFWAILQRTNDSNYDLHWTLSMYPWGVSNDSCTAYNIYARNIFLCGRLGLCHDVLKSVINHNIFIRSIRTRMQLFNRVRVPANTEGANDIKQMRWWIVVETNRSVVIAIFSENAYICSMYTTTRQNVWKSYATHETKEMNQIIQTMRIWQ